MDADRTFGEHRVRLSTLCESNENPYVKVICKSDDKIWEKIDVDQVGAGVSKAQIENMQRHPHNKHIQRSYKFGVIDQKDKKRGLAHHWPPQAATSPKSIENKAFGEEPSRPVGRHMTVKSKFEVRTATASCKKYINR